jgi:enoyl-CoA hydratase/carnithine racemase
MTEELASLDVEGPTATVTLDRPEAGNRLNAAVLDAVAAHLEAVSARADVHVLVLRGRGPDFSLGREGPALGRPPTPADLNPEFARVQRVNELLEDFPGVTVSAVRGRALGAGASLACRADLVLAAQGAVLGFPEVPHGIAPTVVASYFAHRLPRTALLDLLLTGREVDAVEAQRLGLVSRVVPDARFDEELGALVAHCAGLDPEIVRTIKSFLGTAVRLDPRDAVRYGIALLVNQVVDRGQRVSREGVK